MPSRRKLPDSVIAQVRIRARGLCEYCHAADQWQYVSFTIDHVIPISQGGGDDIDNLGLACFHCNRHKSNATTAFDPETRVIVSLFNPRTDSWDEHFAWSNDGLRIIGLTAIGRATVEALDMNRDRLIAIRMADATLGRHPPLDDRRLSDS